jgi:hypothetical protein
VSYGLGIYVLNLLIGFLSPQVDPKMEGMDGVALPTQGSNEFNPFIRRLPEFKFWFLLIPSPFSFVCHAFSFSAILLLMNFFRYLKIQETKFVCRREFA